jgi:phage gp16-like protein
VIAHSTLAKIHIAKKQLELDDDAYRAMLRGVAGVDSARDLTPQAASKLFKHMERCGFVPRVAVRRRPRVAPTRENQLCKIEALLADAGRPWAYVQGIVKRICKVDAIEFCDGERLAKLIAALQIDAKRHRSRISS